MANVGVVMNDSFIFTIKPEFPNKKEFRQLNNAARDAAAAGDYEKAAQLVQKMRDLLRIFDAIPTDDYPDWEWDLCVMHSWAESTFQNYPAAVEWELRALKIATRDDQRARNLNNLSDHYLRMELYDEAVRFAQQAFGLWSDNEGIICNLSLALAKAGFITDAAALVTALGDGSDRRKKQSILTAHLRHEKELQKVLPALLSNSKLTVSSDTATECAT